MDYSCGYLLKVCIYNPHIKYHILAHNLLFAMYINPLPTNDTFWRRQILAACYQLAQSVLKIGSALAEKVGQGRWVGPPFCLTVHGGGCSCL